MSRTTRLYAVAALALAAASAQAQPVYRIVGPDGKVTFSDRPPSAGAAAAPTGTPGSTSPADALPYALRQIATRFPVTLYTSSDCAPCDSARQLLIGRGTPFSERTVNTNEDVDALKGLSGETSLPFGTIGAQQLKGFSDVEWNQYLDAAGYPRQSQLPPAYRRPAPVPLVAITPASVPASTPEPKASRPAAPAPAPAPNPSNPAGLVF